VTDREVVIEDSATSGYRTRSMIDEIAQARAMH